MTTPYPSAIDAPAHRTAKRRGPSYCQFHGCATDPSTLIAYHRWQVCPACYRLITAERLRSIGMYRGGPNTWEQQGTAARVEMCFAALGVLPGCGEDALRSAWRKIAKAHHPDHGGDPEMFILLKEAYDMALSVSGLATEGGAI